MIALPKPPSKSAAVRRSATCPSTAPAVSLAALALAAACLGIAGTTDGGQVKRLLLDTPQALAGARSQGIAVFPDGSLAAMAPLVKVAEFEEPLGLALAVDEDGTAFVGTGHPARVWRVQNGTKKLLAELEADQVTALLVDPTGTLWAATAVPASLVRFSRGGDPIVASVLPEGNLWDLAWFKGVLIAAAGNPGRLLRLGAHGLELAATVPDRHARCLATSGTELLVGTSGLGLVLRWSGEGPVGVLFDSPFTEIAALAVDGEGVAYAAAITGDPTLGKPAKESSDASVTVSTEETPQLGDTGGATSEILRVLPAGAVVTAHRFPKQLASTLAVSPSGLVIGTAADGELWQLVDGAAAQLDTVDAAQISRLARSGAWVLSQGPIALYRRSGSPKGMFTSPPLDAGQPAEWGEIRVGSELPAAGRCAVRLRTGVTATPDDTWSGWSETLPCARARAAVPPARYAQWRLELEAPAGETARVARVTVAYQQINLPPEIKEVAVHDPGEVFLKTPPPSDRVVEVQHPDLSGIFTTLDDDPSERQSTLGKLYYRVGYQTVSWKAGDPNSDPLRFAVEIGREGGTEFLPVREDLESTLLMLDTQSLADGVYRFRVTASDIAANPVNPAVTTRLSPSFVVDNTQPRLTVTRSGEWWIIRAEDAASAISRVEWNRDADRWHALVPEDGLLDGPEESFKLPVEPGHHVLSVRAVDEHHNRTAVAVEEGR